MKKLRLESLQVESFATTAPVAPARGTVLGRERTASNCPESWDGTCWITCANCESNYDPC